jgi:hypothetical protein
MYKTISRYMQATGRHGGSRHDPPKRPVYMTKPLTWKALTYAMWKALNPRKRWRKRMTRRDT